jgi:hypothetical protein
MIDVIKSMIKKVKSYSKKLNSKNIHKMVIRFMQLKEIVNSTKT